MNTLTQKQISSAFVATNNMINEMEVKIKFAVSENDWLHAAELSAYVRGMKQVMIIFEKAINDEEETTEEE